MTESVLLREVHSDPATETEPKRKWLDAIVRNNFATIARLWKRGLAPLASTAPRQASPTCLRAATPGLLQSSFAGTQ